VIAFSIRSATRSISSATCWIASSAPSSPQPAT
jgi:hypothetical protein